MKKLIIIFCIILIVSCNTNNCADIFPAPPIASFAITDSNGKNLVSLVEDNIYRFDSIRLFNDELDVELSFVESVGLPPRIGFDYGDFLPDVNYFLVFNEKDKDTLRFNFFSEDTDCFYLYKIEKVYHNNIELEVFDNRKFNIIK